MCFSYISLTRSTLFVSMHKLPSSMPIYAKSASFVQFHVVQVCFWTMGSIWNIGGICGFLRTFAAKNPKVQKLLNFGRSRRMPLLLFVKSTLPWCWPETGAAYDDPTMVIWMGACSDWQCLAFQIHLLKENDCHSILFPQYCHAILMIPKNIDTPPRWWVLSCLRSRSFLLKKRHLRGHVAEVTLEAAMAIRGALQRANKARGANGS